MSNTPETDEIVEAYHEQRESVGGIIEHAESMERERNDTRTRVTDALAAFRDQDMQTCERILNRAVSQWKTLI